MTEKRKPLLPWVKCETGWYFCREYQGFKIAFCVAPYRDGSWGVKEVLEPGVFRPITAIALRADAEMGMLAAEDYLFDLMELHKVMIQVHAPESAPTR
jgi:hypothetical protein